MEKKKIIANWKSNKTAEETILFLDTLKQAWAELPLADKEIIILPSFTSLSAAYAYCIAEDLPLSLGAQNISAHGEGAFTGEVNGKQIAEFATYVLINHSERRRHNHEADQEARAKVLEARNNNLTPLFCIQDENSAIPDEVTEIVYEPPSAISTFQQDAHVQTASEIERVFGVIKGRFPSSNVYYGGSVNPETVSGLVRIPNLSGFLIGAASLDVMKFTDILTSW